jgi:hypothetical protein
MRKYHARLILRQFLIDRIPCLYYFCTRRLKVRLRIVPARANQSSGDIDVEIGNQAGG